ncbi:hypothetical protein Tco_0003896 [Tanacetum coccineum]
MSDSDESGVTHTEVSSPFEDLSDIGSPRADDHELLELPYMPEDPYLEAALQAPPSPDYVPGPEEPEHAPPSPDYVPGAEHADDEIVAEDHPYAEDASPIAQSPDYVPESDPEADPEEDDDEDPEEDPIDYPADGGDSEMMRWDRRRREGATQSLLPVVVAFTATAPSAGGLSRLRLMESAAIAPPHLISMTARISIPDITCTSMRLILRLPDVAIFPPRSPLSPCYFPFTTITPPPPQVILSPTRPDAPPPLPTSAPTSFPPLLLPSDSRREDRPEVNLPPRMGLGIALGPRCEVGREASPLLMLDTAEVLGQIMVLLPLWTGRLGVTQRDMLDMGSRIHGMRLLRPYRELQLVPIQSWVKHERRGWGRAMDASDLAHGGVISLRTTVHAQMSEITELQSADRRRQRAISDLLETDRRRREEMRELRAADRTRQQQIVQTLTVMQTLQREDDSTSGTGHHTVGAGDSLTGTGDDIT